MSELKDWNVAAASNNSASPNGAPEGMAPSGVNDTIREIMAVLKRWKADNDGSTTSGGSANAYTLTPNGTYSAYAQGDTFVFEASFSNTGAATVNVSSLGAKSIKDTSGAALVGGEIVSGGVYILVYDGTNFLLLNPFFDVTQALGAKSLTAQSFNFADSSIDLGSLSRSYSPTTSSQDLFDITLGQANACFEATVTFEDITSANGSIVWKLYVACYGSGTTLTSVTLIQEDKVRAASGSLTNYGTWAASISSNKVRLSHTGTVASGSGTLTITALGRHLTIPLEAV